MPDEATEHGDQAQYLIDLGFGLRAFALQRLSDADFVGLERDGTLQFRVRIELPSLGAAAVFQRVEEKFNFPLALYHSISVTALSSVAAWRMLKNRRRTV